MNTCSALQFTIKNSLQRTFDLFLSNLPVHHLTILPSISLYVKIDAHHTSLEFEAELFRLNSSSFRQTNFGGLKIALARPRLSAMGFLISFLVNCKQYISLPRCIIFNENLKDCYFHNLWKKALIISIFKTAVCYELLSHLPSLLLL